MKVRELIEQLQAFHPDAEVGIKIPDGIVIPNVFIEDDGELGIEVVQSSGSYGCVIVGQV